MQIVNEKHSSSGGSCGTYIAELIRDLNACAVEMGRDISELHKEGLIEVREGIHGFMIMKKVK